MKKKVSWHLFFLFRKVGKPVFLAGGHFHLKIVFHSFFDEARGHGPIKNIPCNLCLPAHVLKRTMGMLKLLRKVN